MKNAVTITMIFEASALNRDEGAGGNIITIKKLARGDGKVYSFISRPAIRHYLFTTLHRMNPERWKATPVSVSQKVVQFKILMKAKEQNSANEFYEIANTIKDSAELDVFGYMVTLGKEGETGGNITRKAPLGITKAISLEPWQGDMAMYANHELVRRGISQGYDATPDPYNKEEHFSYYKVSFVLDLERIGKDEWYGQEIKKENEEILLTVVKGKNKSKNKIIKIPIEKGDILQNGKERVYFEVNEDEIKGRVEDILHAVKNGLTYHVSGESEVIKPKFLIAALVKIPAPVFHTCVEAEKISPLTLNSNLLDEGLRNEWIINDEKPVIYIYAAPGVRVETMESGLKWNVFLNKVLDELTEKTSESKTLVQNNREEKQNE